MVILFARWLRNGEDENEVTELKYLTVIKEIREKDPSLFEKIKLLPRKARSAKATSEVASLITYFRKDKIQKFFQAKKNESCELDFLSAAGVLECSENEKRLTLPPVFYDCLDLNKNAFIDSTTEELVDLEFRRGRDTAQQILRILKVTVKNTQQLTEGQDIFIKTVMARLEDGAIPKQTCKTTYKALNDLGNQVINPLKVLAILQTHISENLLAGHYAEQNPRTAGKREVILSMYLSGENNG